jgi:hypothetical protein
MLIVVSRSFRARLSRTRIESTNIGTKNEKQKHKMFYFSPHPHTRAFFSDKQPPPSPFAHGYLFYYPRQKEGWLFQIWTNRIAIFSSFSQNNNILSKKIQENL